MRYGTCHSCRRAVLRRVKLVGIGRLTPRPLLGISHSSFLKTFSPLRTGAGSGQPSAEVKLSLDSSVEGILVGDKRRRGSSRGKRGARVAEDNAHRSSRSRHLSPMIPVSDGYGFARHGELLGSLALLWSPVAFAPVVWSESR